MPPASGVWDKFRLRDETVSHMMTLRRGFNMLFSQIASWHTPSRCLAVAVPAHRKVQSNTCCTCQGCEQKGEVISVLHLLQATPERCMPLLGHARRDRARGRDPA